MSEENRVCEWDSTLSFLMAMIGAAIGLGNIWRYPYIAYTNGGGSFLIPYLCAILILGLPFMFLEYAVGFKFKTSLSNTLKKIKPHFEVIGWFVGLIAFLVLCYYVCIVGWDLIYIILSFFKGWGANPSNFLSVSLLHSQNNLSGLSYLVWPVVASLIFIWILIWAIAHTDLNSGIARISKLLIPLLVIMMAVVVFFSLTLPGASLGYTKLLTPKWGLLLTPDVWLAAFGQILFSLSLGISVIISYASYLPKGEDLIRDGLIVVASNCGFEVFTAFGVFSILGFMAFSQGVPVDHVVTQGSGLIFVAFPTVLNIMGNYAYIIGPLFFLCIFFAGITTTISYLEPLSLALTRKFKLRRKVASTLLCIIGFGISLIFATGSGSFLVTIFDGFLNQFGLLFGIICQCLIFGWYYKIDDLLAVINNNSRFSLGKIWKGIIRYVLPIILCIVWISGLYELFTSGDIVSIYVQLIIALVLIIVPTILTILPKSDKKLPYECRK
jgi:NSS family neurotransmitter:Na+ symporter